MANQTHLLDDAQTLAAVTAHADLRFRPGHRVIGLHDDVLVRGWRCEEATVEVVISTRTGRVYAQRYRGTLSAFLAAAAEETVRTAA
ncbi:hypothetical protein [Paenarthrobacter sp. C1]|uniref:hypothetical protein n=1 Tax=Paenarthrobacter sp. C1 TaxID=3400220 RepID=UPI003BF509A7